MASYGLQRTVEPTVEPVTLAELKSAYRIEHDEDDTTLTAMIVAARQVAEAHCQRTLITTTWALTLDEFPTWRIRLPMPKLIAISSIVYLESAAGASTTFSSASYRANIAQEPGVVEPVYGGAWPVARSTTGAVVITYTAGYGATAASVPEAIKQAIKLTAHHWYQHFDEPETKQQDLPPAAKALLMQFWSGEY